MDNLVVSPTEAGFDVNLPYDPGVIEKTKKIIPEIISFITHELTDLEQYYVAQGLDFLECMDD